MQAVGYTVLSARGRRWTLCRAWTAAGRPGPCCGGKPSGRKGLPGLDTSPPLRAVHTLLCACAGPSFCPPAWEPFYLDVSHRMRHGLCRPLRGMGRGHAGRLCHDSGAVPFSAVLGAVAVHPDFRRQGWGTRVVRGILSSLPEALPCFVLRDARETRDFYASLGFSPCGNGKKSSGYAQRKEKKTVKLYPDFYIDPDIREGKRSGKRSLAPHLCAGG